MSCPTRGGDDVVRSRQALWVFTVVVALLALAAPASGLAQSDDAQRGSDDLQRILNEAMDDPDAVMLSNSDNSYDQERVVYAMVDAVPTVDGFCTAVARVATTIAGREGPGCLDGVVAAETTTLTGDSLLVALDWAESVGVAVAFTAPPPLPTEPPRAGVQSDDKPEAHCVGARPPAPFR